jgi:hypothetical protein
MLDKSTLKLYVQLGFIVLGLTLVIVFVTHTSLLKEGFTRLLESNTIAVFISVVAGFGIAYAFSHFSESKRHKHAIETEKRLEKKAEDKKRLVAVNQAAMSISAEFSTLVFYVTQHSKMTLENFYNKQYSDLLLDRSFNTLENLIKITSNSHFLNKRFTLYVFDMSNSLYNLISNNINHNNELYNKFVKLIIEEGNSDHVNIKDHDDVLRYVSATSYNNTDVIDDIQSLIDAINASLSFITKIEMNILELCDDICNNIDISHKLSKYYDDLKEYI